MDSEAVTEVILDVDSSKNRNGLMDSRSVRSLEKTGGSFLLHIHPFVHILYFSPYILYYLS